MSLSVEWKWEPGSCEFSLLSGAGFSGPPDRVMSSRIHLYHPCEHPVFRLAEFYRKDMNIAPRISYLELELNLSLCCSYNTKL